MPTIVARKMASSCHAFRETPEGTGTNQRMTPVAIDASNGFIAAPCHGCGAGEAGAGAEAEALTVSFFEEVSVGIDLRSCGDLNERLLVSIIGFGFREIERGVKFDLVGILRFRDLSDWGDRELKEEVRAIVAIGFHDLFLLL